MEREYKNYVRVTHDKDFRTTKQSDGVWCIQGRYGTIIPNYINLQTCIVILELTRPVDDNWHKDNLRMINRLTKNLSHCVIWKDYGIGIFNPEFVNLVAKEIKAKKRKQISPETREKLVASMKKINEAKNQS